MDFVRPSFSLILKAFIFMYSKGLGGEGMKIPFVCPKTFGLVFGLGIFSTVWLA